MFRGRLEEYRVKLLVAAVGRLKSGAERDLFDRYRSRCNAAGRAVGLGPLTLHELPESRRADVQERKADEASRLLALCDGVGVRVVLDEHGRGTTSTEFAATLSTFRDGGIQSLAFIIGGPDGHDQTVLSAANRILSLSTMTLPHGLARVVLVEQIYRAVTILSRHPYHRE